MCVNACNDNIELVCVRLKEGSFGFVYYFSLSRSKQNKYYTKKTPSHFTSLMFRGQKNQNFTQNAINEKLELVCNCLSYTEIKHFFLFYFRLCLRETFFLFLKQFIFFSALTLAYTTNVKKIQWIAHIYAMV